MKTKILLAALFLSALTIGCNGNDDNETVSFTAEEATANAQLDIMNNDVSQIVENQATAQDGFTGRDSQDAQDYLPTCATVTRIPEFGTGLETGQLVTKTIDFGTSGCPLSNGNILKGKIIVTFTYEPNATSHTINYTFDNFYHNAIKFDGNKTFTRVMGTSSANAETHPIVTMNMDFTATFPNGNVYHRVGSRVREITAGFNTPNILADNVYQVTGSWTTTLAGTPVLSSTITTPLIVKLNCGNIVEGVIEYERNGNTASLDYGDGECDNQAVFTFNGTPHTIVLGN
ncbi:MAG: hypothetical protein PSV16_13815 [Flavobacterium sp.]|nr:hypothetical protein [Flavobacterium sp.]